MGTIIVTVNVGNVFPPSPITVNIKNLDTGVTLPVFTSPKSFTHTFSVANGNYTVIVSGTNQMNDQTNITVGGTFNPGGSTTENEPMYITPFVGAA